MRHQPHAIQRTLDHVCVANVADDVLDIDVGPAQVKYHRFKSGLQRRLEDVRADEARAAGDQHPGHRHTVWSLGAPRKSPSASFSSS